MGEYLTELLMISNVYVQEVNKAILPLSDATEPIAVASLLYLAKSMKTQMSAETIEIAERIEKLMESSFSMTQTRKKTLIKSVSDCRQSPGICRDFYYEHCFSGIIQLSERRCFL